MFPLTSSAADLQGQLASLKAWELVEGHHLRRTFRFADFAAALAWLNRAGAVCEQQGHHADFLLRWGSVRVEIWTHDVDGLTPADPQLAQALDRLPLSSEMP